jgi:hypothetical protein
MAGSVLNSNAVVLCQHGGNASPTAVSARVMIASAPISTIQTPYRVTGCPLQPAALQCVTATWLVGALRVSSENSAVVIETGIAVCQPTLTPLSPKSFQTRVLAT